MKRFVLLILVSFFAWLICDPGLINEPHVGGYVLTGPGWVPPVVASQPDGSLKLDISQAPDGFSTITVKACPSDVAPFETNEVRCSPTVNLLLGIKTGTFPSGRTTVQWKEWWIPGR